MGLVVVIVLVVPVVPAVPLVLVVLRVPEVCYKPFRILPSPALPESFCSEAAVLNGQWLSPTERK